MSIFRGSATAVITPFRREDQALDFDAFADIIDQQISGGTDALVVCGSTGEAAAMTEKEHMDTVRFCIEYTKHRLPVIAGTGSNCTATAASLTRQAADMQADAVLVITPYYNKATQNGLVAHFETVAKAAGSTPLIIYNVPSRTGCNILPETVAKLVKEVPNIVGIKEASGNLSQIGHLMALTDGNIELYSGNDDQTVPILSVGGLGVISVVANVAPKAMHDMCAKFFAGDIAGAAELQRAIDPLFNCLFSEVNPIPVKAAMNMLGLKAGVMRLPLTEMEPEHAAKLRQAMIDFGLRLA